jgi:hypothetical protein
MINIFKYKINTNINIKYKKIMIKFYIKILYLKYLRYKVVYQVI